MAHGVDQSKKTIFVKLEDTKKGKKPKFTYKEGETVTEGDFLEGYVTDVRPDSYEYEGKTVPTVVISLVDGKDNYKLEVSYTSMSRTILNAMATIDIYGKVKIKVVQGKDGDYNSVFVNVDEAKAQSWKYKYDDLSQYISPSASEGGMADYSRLDKFFETLVVDVLGPFFKSGYAQAVADGIIVDGAHKDDTPAPVEDGSVRTKDIDVSSEIPEQNPAEAEMGRPPVTDEEESDLPF